MIAKPMLPENEAHRLADLLSYEILDTPPEEAFDDLIDLAAFVTQTPIATLGLIDQNRQWFKSKLGVTVSESFRATSFSEHVVRSGQFLVVNDARTDARFAALPVVTGAPQVVFYAGAPLISPSGHTLGALSVLHTEPHEISKAQEKALYAITRQIMTLFERRKSDVTLRSQGRQIRDMAKQVLKHEAELVESARLAALANMAGHLAHEINNPLAIIHGTVNHLLKADSRGTSTPEDRRQMLERVLETTAIVTKIITALQAFGRKDTVRDFAEVSLNGVVAVALSLCQSRIASLNITLEVALPQRDLVHRCLPSQLSQAVMNLLNNAVEAVEARPDKWIRLELTESADFYLISVADSGAGVSESHKGKIMLPFYTTKKTGKGNGLGLSMVHGIAQRHSGDIQLDTTASVTKFVLRLPKTVVVPAVQTA